MSPQVLVDLASVFSLHEWIHLDWMGWLWTALEQVEERKSRRELISDPDVLMDTSIIWRLHILCTWWKKTACSQFASYDIERSDGLCIALDQVDETKNRLFCSRRRWVDIWHRRFNGHLHNFLHVVTELKQSLQVGFQLMRDCIIHDMIEKIRVGTEVSTISSWQNLIGVTANILTQLARIEMWVMWKYSLLLFWVCL